jgi:hypothetical protein
MNDRDNTNTLWAIDVLHRFAPHPLVDTTDYHVECFRRQCERDAGLRELMADRDEEARREPSDAETYFLEQQCPSDATFR